ncbi:MAG: hypothetical protein NW224_13050 [Leptolyngbyaceae cyanobacterium bins.302]|nr:hypothetical protein [Leptolyngbyaceae cyanobacterium bins.302]
MLMNTSDMVIAIREAWSSIPPPPTENLEYVAWGSVKEAWQTFIGIAPVDVDISSPSFLGCTPLLDLPPAIAAPYLGTYLLSLLDGLEFQENLGVFYDVLTRAHTIHCLSEPDFWRQVIRPYLPTECQQTLVTFCSYLASRRELLALSEEQIDWIVALSKENLPPKA